MSMGKFLDPKNHLPFKRIFESEKNKDILLHFLNDIFASQTGEIQSVMFLKPNQEPEIASQRMSIVDIMCQASNGDRFIFQMQVKHTHEPGFEKRAQFYAALNEQISNCTPVRRAVSANFKISCAASLST